MVVKTCLVNHIKDSYEQQMQQVIRERVAT
jgi:hypothetical protein